MDTSTFWWQVGSHVILPLSAAIVVYYLLHHLPEWFHTISKRLTTCTFLKSKHTPTHSTATSLDAADDLPAAVVGKELDFPSDWWTSPTLFALEKRAILSKTWLHVSHASLFPEPGDYRTFVTFPPLPRAPSRPPRLTPPQKHVADFSFLLIRGRDGHLRAFHNVCRHRAYTVATQPVGRSSVLRCRYHGWTYNTRGRLVHAPQFDAVANFDPQDNGLHEIRAFVDSSGVSRTVHLFPFPTRGFSPSCRASGRAHVPSRPRSGKRGRE